MLRPVTDGTQSAYCSSTCRSHHPVRGPGNLKSTNDVISERVRFKLLGNWTRSCGVFVCLFVCPFVMQLCVYQQDGPEVQRSKGHLRAVLCGSTAYNCMQITGGVVLITQMCYLPCGTLHWPASSFLANRKLYRDVSQKAIRGLLAEPLSWPIWLQGYFSFPPSGI